MLHSNISFITFLELSISLNYGKSFQINFLIMEVPVISINSWAFIPIGQKTETNKKKANVGIATILYLGCPIHHHLKQCCVGKRGKILHIANQGHSPPAHCGWMLFPRARVGSTQKTHKPAQCKLLFLTQLHYFTINRRSRCLTSWTSSLAEKAL